MLDVLSDSWKNKKGVRLHGMALSHEAMAFGMLGLVSSKQLT